MGIPAPLRLYRAVRSAHDAVAASRELWFSWISPFATIEDDNWANEYDRPMYFVELREGYRCVGFTWMVSAC